MYLQLHSEFITTSSRKIVEMKMLVSVLFFNLLAVVFTQGSNLTQLNGKIRELSIRHVRPTDTVLSHIRGGREKSLVALVQDDCHLCCGALLNLRCILIPTTCHENMNKKKQILAIIGVAHSITGRDSVFIKEIFRVEMFPQLSIATLKTGVNILARHISLAPLRFLHVNMNPVQGVAVGMNMAHQYQIEIINGLSRFGDYFYAQPNMLQYSDNDNLYSGRLLFNEKALIGIAVKLVNNRTEPNHPIEGINVFYVNIIDKISSINSMASELLSTIFSENSKRSRKIYEQHNTSQIHEGSSSTPSNHGTVDITPRHGKSGASSIKSTSIITPERNEGIALSSDTTSNTSPKHGQGNSPSSHGTGNIPLVHKRDSALSSQVIGDISTTHGGRDNTPPNEEIRMSVLSDARGNTSRNQGSRNTSPSYRKGDTSDNQGRESVSPSREKRHVRDGIP